VLQKRSVDVFPSAYATLLSIVQGIALGTLAISLVPVWQQREGIELWALLGEGLLTAAALVVVYYNYVWFLLVFRWAPGVLDTVIPFMLGAGEIALASMVGNHFAWCIAFAVLYGFGGLGFWHTLHRGSRAMFASQMTFRLARRLLIGLAWLSAAGTPLGVIAALFTINFGATSALAYAFVTLIAAVAMIVMSEQALRRIYDEHALVRLPLFSKQ
jgi:hypothetical protein